MTARAAFSPEQRRAEVEGQRSGFHFAVGYLQASVEHGSMVDPAHLLERMTLEAERTAAIWLAPSAHEHPTSDSAPPPAAADGGSGRLSAAAPGPGGPAGGGLLSGGHLSPAVIDRGARALYAEDAATDIPGDEEWAEFDHSRYRDRSAELLAWLAAVAPTAVV